MTPWKATEVKPSLINTDDLFCTLQVTGATANLCRLQAPQLEGDAHSLLRPREALMLRLQPLAGQRLGWVRVVEVQPVQVGDEPPPSVDPATAKASTRSHPALPDGVAMVVVGG